MPTVISKRKCKPGGNSDLGKRCKPVGNSDLKRDVSPLPTIISTRCKPVTNSDLSKERCKPVGNSDLKTTSYHIKGEWKQGGGTTSDPTKIWNRPGSIENPKDKFTEWALDLKGH